MSRTVVALQHIFRLWLSSPDIKSDLHFVMCIYRLRRERDVCFNLSGDAALHMMLVILISTTSILPYIEIT